MSITAEDVRWPWEKIQWPVDRGRTTYAGMSKSESRIWSRFINHAALGQGNMYYNVRIGRTIPTQAGSEQWMKSIVAAVSRLRVDAVLEKPDSWWLFEVKPRAGLSAVGQCIGYSYLLSEALPDDRPVLSVIVCDQIDMNVFSVCEWEGIGLYAISPRWGRNWTPPKLAQLFGRLAPHVPPGPWPVPIGGWPK